MINIVIGILIVLHGLVHLLYLGQSQRFFEMRPQMVWPDGSWAFSHLFGPETTRMLAGTGCALAAIGFVVGGTGVLIGQMWWRPIVISVAVFSAALYILFWDGYWRKLDEKGGIGLLINIALVAMAFLWQQPN
jgi:hypothetical protein